MPELAAEMKRVVAKPDDFKALTPLLFSRILNANYRYGNAEQAPLIAEFAATASVPESVRIAALGMLNDWAQPTVVDPVLGLPRPIAKRDKLVVDETIKSSLKKLFSENGAISARAVELALAFGVELSDDLLLSFVKDTKRGEAIRVTSLQQLQAKKNKALAALLPQLATDGSLNVRVAALGALIETDEAAGLKAASEILDGKGPPPNAINVVIDRSNGDWNVLKMGAPAKNDYADQSKRKQGGFLLCKRLWRTECQSRCK